MNLDPIATRELCLLHENGRSEVRIEIGAPRWVEKDIEAACSVYIRGLMRSPLEIYGSDLLSALECALSFVNAELKNVPERKVLAWSDGEPYF